MITTKQFNEWLGRLRSGKYRQTNQVLKRYDTDDSAAYCCLGVLADILVEDGLLKERDTHAIADGIANFEPTDPTIAATPEDGLDFAALLPNEIIAVNKQNVYAAMNDGGDAFYAIADRIAQDEKALTRP